MSIQILPAQLANQIAAGEVVERPASVVKELVENSLDAGATSIEVEIDRGGHKRILVRDDGSGVSKQELTLALSRHATSKLATQDDLEHIATLGFRGEALASISSVSRLTMTSRPAEQETAWQASAMGRDMAVTVTPAAHPQGTSVEVLDLFFNTPARRKFLRSEKTEFMHIDELMKRLALSHYQVSIKLTHNGKLLRHYRAASQSAEYERRVASVLGKAFIRSSLQLDNQHQSLHLWGWLGTPEIARSSNDLQYFYVNGRVIRDKLIYHAIRQCFTSILEDAQLYPAYVLYLELPPEQVDVNVHPTKHEVRFHQARLIHDYIQRVLQDVLHQYQPENETIQAAPPRHQYTPASEFEEAQPIRESVDPSVGYQPQPLRFHEQRPASAQIQAQQQWQMPGASNEVAGEASAVVAGHLRPLQLLKGRFLCVGDHISQIALFDLGLAWSVRYQQLFVQQWSSGITRAPLLLPQLVSITDETMNWLSNHVKLMQQLGFLIRCEDSTLIVLEVPSCMRRVPLPKMLESLLNILMIQTSALDDEAWLCQQLAEQASQWLQFNWSAALGLYQACLDENGQLPVHLCYELDEQKLIEAAH
ncbi:DNA mismatch repair endonuclease MutL [Celerinatantimonas sp. YJH-8]|uniref:DNA mismatch repair endonuclease MutL n=1 Tax=Celerinatantimonas sp. YJH-8 TaxID=3228714 RepID=UPI0038CC1159